MKKRPCALSRALLLVAGVSLAITVASAAPVLGVDCATIAGNVMPSCGFENASEVANWTLNGDSLTFAAGAGEGGGGAARVDAVDLGGGTGFTMTIASPCMLAQGAQTFDLGFVARLQAGTAATCTGYTDQYSDGGCGSYIVGQSIAVAANLAGAYQAIEAEQKLQPTTNSFKLALNCVATGAEGDFSVEFDNAFAVPGPVTIVEVPALDATGSALLGLALLGGGLAALRRRRRTF